MDSVMFLALLEEYERRQMANDMRRLRDTSNPFSLTLEQFTRLFRLSQDAVFYLADTLGNSLERERASGLAVEIQILTALRFCATGSYQRSVGCQYLLSVSQPAVSRALRDVTQAVVDRIVHDWIRFPTTEAQRSAIKNRFYTSRHFKGVIGCIDCTHVAIMKPQKYEESYLNHKGFHSINVQVVSSQDLEILSINARYPGSVHDSFIWKSSAVRKEMMRLWDSGETSSWLLGDSGYPLEPWLMTPILNAADGSIEAKYTECHCSTRNCVERLFGVWKNTWRCLLHHRVLHYQPLAATRIILACAVFHNMRHRYNLMDELFDEDYDMESEEGNTNDIGESILHSSQIEIEEGHESIGLGDRLSEARRVQKRILRIQFSPPE